MSKIGIQETAEYALGWDWAEHGMEILPWMERHLTSEQKVALNLGWQDYHDQESKP